MTNPTSAFRVFPWDPAAPDGERFSPGFVPPNSGRGRFDRPGTAPATLYLAETPEHAVAEVLQVYRGKAFKPHHLLQAGHTLALASVALSPQVWQEIVDLCEPAELVRLGTRPDLTASLDRNTTQGVAAKVAGAQHAGVRWWSFYSGDWHMIAVFSERLRPPPVYTTPEPLSPTHPAVIAAADALSISL